MVDQIHGRLAVLVVVVIVCAAIGASLAGCGSSSDSTQTQAITVPAITAPLVPDAQPTRTAGGNQGAIPPPAEAARKNPAEPTAGVANSRDQSKARNGGSSGRQPPSGPTDAQKAENPGKHGGSSGGTSDNADQQKAGG